MPRRKVSRLVSIRLPTELEAAIRSYAGDRPWQTVLKEILSERLGVLPAKRISGEIVTHSSNHLLSALRKLNDR